MSLNYPYFLRRVPRPVPSLGGRSVRPRPIVGVMMFGPAGSRALDATLDTGADDTVFPEQFAALLRIDLTRAPLGEAAGMSGSPIPVRYAQAELRLSDGVEIRRWSAMIAFGKLSRPLLGFAGCLQFFTATFHGDRERVELAVNSLYPGT